MRTDSLSLPKRGGHADARPPRFVVKPLACCVMLACCDASLANPTGAQIVSGIVTMQRPDARTLNVTNSPNAIINWQGFSIGANEVTRFAQQSASSAVLNRVVGADISQIHGQLVSNGRVFLINPAGIVIGAGGLIDTAGFVGSTLNMLDGDFLAGKLKFQGDGNSGSIVNQGWIKAGQGGNIVLVAPSIENSGVLEARGGEIVLAAGQKLTIGSRNLEGIQFEIQAPTDSVLNVGKLLAEDGAVGVFAGTLRHSGDIRAHAIVRDAAGRIVLKAQGDVTLAAGSSTSANGKTGGSITIQSQTGTTLISGAVEATASAGHGGSVQILGHVVALSDAASVNASGESGGGTILLGGDYQGGNAEVQNAWRAFVGRDATLRADAIGSGDGGRIIVWSDDVTRYYGSSSARGGERLGNGGFVEVSGKRVLNFNGAVDTSAPRGKAGTLLLDPTDISIVAADGPPPNTECSGPGPGCVGATAPPTTYQESGTPDAASEIPVANLRSALGSGDVIINTANGAPGNGDINLNAELDFNTIGTTPRTLTLNATRDININQRIFDSVAGGNTLNVAMTANRDIMFANPTTYAANLLTANAGRSILVSGNIAANNANVTLTANSLAIPGPRGVGTAVLTMAPGTFTNAGTGIIRLILDSGSGGGASGNMTIASLTANHVSILHNGPTANGSILRAAGTPTLNVSPTSGNVHLEIEQPAGGPSSSIGTSAAPLVISAGGGGLAVLEAHYHGGGTGIFVDATTDLQIGGATVVFTGNVKGVQTLTAGGGVAAGPIRITTTGTLSQQALGGPPAACGAGGGVGGPICAGVGTGSTNPLDIVTLRGGDMILQAPIAGNSVVLLPTAGFPIRAGDAGFTTGSLSLSQAEITRITTSSLRIGERVASGDPTSSGSIAFIGSLTAPGISPIILRTGGTVSTSGGTTDIATTNANITVETGAGIGATGAGRLKIAPGTGTVSLVGGSGGIFIEQSVGDLVFDRYTFSTSSSQFEEATTNGDMIGNFASSGSSNWLLVAQGANKNIAISGLSNPVGNSFTFAPSGSTTFNDPASTKTFTGSIITSRPISVGGGAVTFASPVTASTDNGTLTVTDGTATFNSGTASAFRGITVGGGTLAGTGPVTTSGPAGLTFTGGFISNSGGVTVPAGAGGTQVTSGTPQVSGSGVLITDGFNQTGGSFTVVNGGLLRLTGAPQHSIDGITTTFDNLGTVRIVGDGSLILRNGAIFRNRASGVFDIAGTGAGVSVLFLGGGATPTLENIGILRKSAGTLVSSIGSTGGGAQPFNFINSGSIDAQSGPLSFPGTNTFNTGTAFIGAPQQSFVSGTTTLNGTITSNNRALVLSTGTFGGTASLTGTTDWNSGTFVGDFTVPTGSILRTEGSSAKNINSMGALLTNNGTINMIGTGSITLLNSATLRNNGLIDIQSSAGFAGGGGLTPTVFNNAAGTIAKTAPAGSSTFGNNLILDNSGILRADAGTQLVYAGINNFRNNTRFTGGGTNRVFTAASAAFDGTINSQNLTLQAGNFFSSGTFNGTVTWEGGTIVGPLTNAGVFNLTGPNPKTVSNTAFTNNGGIINIDGPGNLVLNNASLPNMNGGTINLRSDAGIQGTGTSPLLPNTGFILKSAGSGTSVISSTVTNSGAGTISSLSGTLQLNNLPQNSGTLVVVNGTISTNGQPLTNNSTGIIAGRGTFNLGTSALTNNGLVAPGTSPGILAITGNYIQGPSGTLLTDIGGTIAGSGFDQLQVSGTVALNGALVVALASGFTGSPGNAYEIITTGVPSGITGNFSTINTTPPGGDFTGAPGTVSYVLTQGGVSGSGPISTPSPSPGSSSSDVSMQSINDVVGLTEVERIPTQEPQLVEEQRKSTQKVGACGP